MDEGPSTPKETSRYEKIKTQARLQGCSAEAAVLAPVGSPLPLDGDDQPPGAAIVPAAGWSTGLVGAPSTPQGTGWRPGTVLGSRHGQPLCRQQAQQGGEPSPRSLICRFSAPCSVKARLISASEC